MSTGVVGSIIICLLSSYPNDLLITGLGVKIFVLVTIFFVIPPVLSTFLLLPLFIRFCRVFKLLDFVSLLLLFRKVFKLLNFFEPSWSNGVSDLSLRKPHKILSYVNGLVLTNVHLLGVHSLDEWTICFVPLTCMESPKLVLRIVFVYLLYKCLLGSNAMRLCVMLFHKSL